MPRFDGGEDISFDVLVDTTIIDENVVNQHHRVAPSAELVDPRRTSPADSDFESGFVDEMDLVHRMFIPPAARAFPRSQAVVSQAAAPFPGKSQTVQSRPVPPQTRACRAAPKRYHQLLGAPGVLYRIDLDALLVQECSPRATPGPDMRMGRRIWTRKKQTGTI